MKKFENIYVIDTNVILNDYENIEVLSQKSSNLIVIPETVMDEIDSKKSGFEDINFQARSFGRLLEKAEILDIINLEGYTISRLFINSDKCITIDVVSKEKYSLDINNTDKHIINDRKILEIAENISKKYSEYSNNIVFVSNDVMCRLRGISLGIKTEPLGRKNDKNIELYTELDINALDTSGELPDTIELNKLIEAYNISETIHGLCLFNSYGERKYYYKSGITFYKIDEDFLKKQNIKPLNAEQKILSSILLDNKNHIYVVDAKAGTGKNSVTLSAAIELLDAKNSVYDKIVYIRKTIISSDTDLGYLPGSLEEKMSGYLSPLYSTLEAIAMRKFNKKRLTEEESKDYIDQLIKKYRITPMWQGHLRGTTIRNAIVIYDESQNDSGGDLKTTLSRMGENTIVYMIGCTEQIDAKYVNKYNNALTYMKNRIGENSNISIAGMTLSKSVRSEIAEWTDTIKI